MNPSYTKSVAEPYSKEWHFQQVRTSHPNNRTVRAQQAYGRYLGDSHGSRLQTTYRGSK